MNKTLTAEEFYKQRLKKRGFNDNQIKELTKDRDRGFLKFAEDYHKARVESITLDDIWYQMQNTEMHEDLKDGFGRGAKWIKKKLLEQ